MQNNNEYALKSGIIIIIPTVQHTILSIIIRVEATNPLDRGGGGGGYSIQCTYGDVPLASVDLIFLNFGTFMGHKFTHFCRIVAIFVYWWIANPLNLPNFSDFGTVKLDIKRSDITNCFLRFQWSNFLCFVLFIDNWYNMTSDITNKLSWSQDLVIQSFPCILMGHKYAHFVKKQEMKWYTNTPP